MTHTIVFIIAFILGYTSCLIGNFEQFKKGRMFYKRNDGTWYPYDPRKNKGW